MQRNVREEIMRLARLPNPPRFPNRGNREGRKMGKLKTATSVMPFDLAYNSDCVRGVASDVLFNNEFGAAPIPLVAISFQSTMVPLPMKYEEYPRNGRFVHST